MAVSYNQLQILLMNYLMEIGCLLQLTIKKMPVTVNITTRVIDKIPVTIATSKNYY